jgi:hypothetical protein
LSALAGWQCTTTTLPVKQTRAETAEQQINAAESVTSNVLTNMTIFNTISEVNQHAKEQIALDASGHRQISRLLLRTMIVLAAVPDGAVKRLQQYADGLHQGAGGAASGKPHG